MQHLEHFHREAVNKNLSAGAILLWHQLYFTMERKQQFADLQQSTAVLMAQLKVTRQGLAVMRQTLADRGFLTVRVDEHQQTFYTLMIDGKAVGESSPLRHTSCATSPEGRGFDEPAAKMPISSPSGRAAERSEAERAGASGDIILTNRIRPYIDTFCEKFGPAMKGDLLQWAEMRRKNGWTLTLWGLEELFKKLIDLSAGNAVQMAQIVAQSVTRRWKGFFALKVKAKPSGDALRKQEEQQYSRRPWEKRTPLQKFKPEGRDLSFLEV